MRNSMKSALHRIPLTVSRVHWSLLLGLIGFIVNFPGGVRFSSAAMNLTTGIVGCLLPWPIAFTGVAFGATWARWVRGLIFGLLALFMLLFAGCNTMSLSSVSSSGVDIRYERLHTYNSPPYRVVINRENFAGALSSFVLYVVQEKDLLPGIKAEKELRIYDRAYDAEIEQQLDDTLLLRVCNATCPQKVITEELLELDTHFWR